MYEYLLYPSRKMLKTWAKFWINKKEINQWIEKEKFIFILSIGRSGTKFLANLLDKSENAYIVHEPVRSDFRAYQAAFHDETNADFYIKKFRKKEIYLRAKERDIEIYGEVNSLLRRFINALKKHFSSVELVHLVRDARDTIRSMYSRKAFKPDDPNTRYIYPKNNDPFREKWTKMDRFEKLCWYWKTENEYLDKNIEKIIKFEDLISNYKVFKNDLILPFGLKISKKRWQEEVNRPKNITKNYTLPHWSQWKEERLEVFNNICGELMKKFKYY